MALQLAWAEAQLLLSCGDGCIGRCKNSGHQVGITEGLCQAGILQAGAPS